MDEQDRNRSTGHTGATKRRCIIDVRQVLGRVEEFETLAGDLRIEVQDRRLDRGLHRFVDSLNRVLVGVTDWDTRWIASITDAQILEFERYGIHAVGDAEVIPVLSIAPGCGQLAVLHVD